MTPEFAYLLKVNVAFVLFTPSTGCSSIRTRSSSYVVRYCWRSLVWLCFILC